MWCSRPGWTVQPSACIFVIVSASVELREVGGGAAGFEEFAGPFEISIPTPQTQGPTEHVSAFNLLEDGDGGIEVRSRGLDIASRGVGSAVRHRPQDRVHRIGRSAQLRNPPGEVIRKELPALQQRPSRRHLHETIEPTDDTCYVAISVAGRRGWLLLGWKHCPPQL